MEYQRNEPKEKRKNKNQNVSGERTQKVQVTSDQKTTTVPIISNSSTMDNTFTYYTPMDILPLAVQGQASCNQHQSANSMDHSLISHSSLVIIYPLD